MSGNMTDIFLQFFHQINQNDIIAFLVTVSILALGFSELIFHPIRNWVNRPKLTFKKDIQQESFEDNNHQLWDRISFWINVKNEGRMDAKKATVYLKLTDESGSINFPRKLSYYTPNQSFQIPWKLAGKDKDTIDILASTEYSGSVKIPLEIEFPLVLTDENKKYALGNYNAKDPISNWNILAVLTGNLEYAFLLKVEIEVNYSDNKPEKKQFIIRTKLVDQLTRDAIEFFPMNDD